MSERTYACRCGEGDGWVTADDGTVRPCEHCRPEPHKKWLAGEFEASWRPDAPSGMHAAIAGLRSELDSKK